VKALRLLGWFRKPIEQATRIPAVPVSASVRKLPYIKSHADYYRRLGNESSFAAEMSEQQRRIGTY
jgi:hypothetical protein